MTILMMKVDSKKQLFHHHLHFTTTLLNRKLQTKAINMRKMYGTRSI